MIFIASDHAGYDLKSQLLAAFSDDVLKDLGPFNKDSVDYPDFADLVSLKTPEAWSATSFGILICGSGQGMAIRANKYPHIRAALCWEPEIARLAREHNDANVLCLPGRFVSLEQSVECIKFFQTTHFAGGRHSQRVAKLSKALNNPNSN